MRRAWRRVCAGNNIGAEGAKAIAPSLAELKGLKHLGLAGAYWRRACFGLALEISVLHMTTLRSALCLRSARVASERAALRFACCMIFVVLLICVFVGCVGATFETEIGLWCVRG